jgi:endonuclease/exonuclease/phosphatase family metal-dependent hydrolase
VALARAPLFQEEVKGKSNAPILGCDEWSDALVRKLVQLSKNGNFTVVVPKVSGAAPIGDFMLVPKRYQVLSAKTIVYASSSPTYPRGLISVRLHDSVTGQKLTAIVTHLGLSDAVRAQEVGQLVPAVLKAEQQGPTVLEGDFVVAANSRSPYDVSFWRELEDETGLTNIDPAVVTAGRSHVDNILAYHMRVEGAQVLTGPQNGIPGTLADDASKVSDHLFFTAEAEVLRPNPKAASLSRLDG